MEFNDVIASLNHSRHQPQQSRTQRGVAEGEAERRHRHHHRRPRQQQPRRSSSSGSSRYDHYTSGDSSGDGSAEEADDGSSSRVSFADSSSYAYAYSHRSRSHGASTAAAAAEADERMAMSGRPRADHPHRGGASASDAAVLIHRAPRPSAPQADEAVGRRDRQQSSNSNNRHTTNSGSKHATTAQTSHSSHVYAYGSPLAADDNNSIHMAAAEGLADVSSLAIYLRERRLDEGLGDVKAVLQRLQRVLEEKERRLAALSAESAAQKETIGALHAEIDRLKRAQKTHKAAVELPMRQQLALLSDGLREKEAEGAQLRAALDEALWAGKDLRGRHEAAANSAEDMRIALEKLRADYDVLIARATANEGQLAEFAKARAGVRGEHEAQLALMEARAASLESQCRGLRRERDAMEDELRAASIGGGGGGASSASALMKERHRALAESAEAHRRAQENIVLEEQLHAAHVNNCRLLRLLMEAEEFGNVFEFSNTLQSFDFIRPDATPATASTTSHSQQSRGRFATGIAGADVVAGSYHDPHRRTTRSKNAFLAAISPKHQRLHDAISCENEYILGCRTALEREMDARRGVAEECGGTGASGALVVVSSHQPMMASPHLVADAALHPFHPTATSGGPLRPREIIDLKTEGDYWVPHKAFLAAQQWRDATVPSVPIKRFYGLFIALNEAWRERMQNRLDTQRRALEGKAKASAATRFHQQQRASRRYGNGDVPLSSAQQRRRGGSNGRNGVLRSLSASAATGRWSNSSSSPSASPLSSAAAVRSLPPLPSAEEVAALRREVATRAISRSAQSLFAAYDSAFEAVRVRAAGLEAALGAANGARLRAERLRRPLDDVVCDRLDGAATVGRAVASQLEEQLCGAGRDVRRFLAAVAESASIDEALGMPSSSSYSSASSAVVPASLLARVSGFMREFTEEVDSRVEAAALSLRRSADASDEALLRHKQMVADERVAAGLGLGREDARGSAADAKEEVDGDVVPPLNERQRVGAPPERRQVRGGGRGRARSASAAAAPSFSLSGGAAFAQKNQPYRFSTSPSMGPSAYDDAHGDSGSGSSGYSTTASDGDEGTAATNDRTFAFAGHRIADDGAGYYVRGSRGASQRRRGRSL